MARSSILEGEVADGVPGWRGLSDDAQRFAFWVGLLAAVVTAVIAGSVYGWWSYYWSVPLEVKFGQGTAIVSAAIVGMYGLLVASHKYFGWPKSHPLHQKPLIVEKVIEKPLASPSSPPQTPGAALSTVVAGGPAPQIEVVPYDGEEAILYVHNTGGDAVFTADAQIVGVDSGTIGHPAPYRMLWRDIESHKVIKGHEFLIPSNGRAKLLIAAWQSGGDWGKPSMRILGDEWGVDSYRHEPWEKPSPKVTIEITFKAQPSLTSMFKRRYSVHIPPKTLSRIVIELQSQKETGHTGHQVSDEVQAHELKRELAVLTATREVLTKERDAIRAEERQRANERDAANQALETVKRQFALARLRWFADRALSRGYEVSVTIRFANYSDYGLVEQIEKILKEHAKWPVTLDGSNKPTLRPGEYKVVIETGLTQVYEPIAGIFDDGRLVPATVALRTANREDSGHLLFEVLPDAQS